MTEDLAFIEHADAAFAEGRPEQALRHYLALLQADPTDLYLWYRVALLLGRLGEARAALDALDMVAARLAESGQLLLALAAAQEMELLRPGSGAERVRAIAALHGQGSRRVGRTRRPAPPPLPERAGVPIDGALDLSDPRLLREAALDASARARAHWAAAAPDAETRLPFHPLLSDLAPEDLVTIATMLRLRVLHAGEVVIEQGAQGSSLFILVRGRVTVSRVAESASGGGQPERTVLATLRSGAFFGELALLTSSPRTARVACDRPSILFELDRQGLEELAGRSERVAAVLGRYTRERLLRTLMATSPLFRPLDEARRESLIGLFETVLLAPGEEAVTEGQPSEELFVVLTGTLQVVKHDEGDEVTLAELGTGQIFGEISLIQNRPATASVRAVGKAVLLALSRAAFNRHVESFPEVLAHVYKVATEREATNMELSEADYVAVDDELLLV